MGRLFGTDGVRGVANAELTPELAFRLGRAGAGVLANDTDRPRILVGRDTRLSGYMLECALAAGITSVGADAVLLGVLPTPAVAYLTRTLAADAGVMISASHNPFPDNGIKFFNRNGFKLSDQVEDAIQALAEAESDALARPTGSALGRVESAFEVAAVYRDFLVASMSCTLAGLRIALDCAHGAASALAPEVLTQLGADVQAACTEPTGMNINVECGSTHAERIVAWREESGADIGLSFDGDADRLIAVDEQGDVVDGDKILAICALERLRSGRLPNNSIAATVYSNGGLNQALRREGGSVISTAAGDRYVLEAMECHGLSLGGEQSGHVIFRDLHTTGDGLLTALQLLDVVVKRRRPLWELAGEMPVYPQQIENIPVAVKDGWEEDAAIQTAIAETETTLAPDGRLFVRASGTEPLIRIMVEHPERDVVASAIAYVADAVRESRGTFEAVGS